MKSAIENLGCPRFFVTNRDMPIPLAYNYFLQMYEIASIQQRPRLEADFFSCIKAKRTDEVIMFKLEKCLQRGQLDRFKSICDTLRINKSIRCPLVPVVHELKSYLERISKLQAEGHGANARRLLSSEIYDFSKNDCAFVYPLKIASELDSGNNLLALQVSFFRFRKLEWFEIKMSRLFSSNQSVYGNV